jgi:hypothetical protein
VFVKLAEVRMQLKQKVESLAEKESASKVSNPVVISLHADL